MKKTILTLVLACGIIGTSFAQNKFSVTQLSNAKNMYEGNQTGFVGIGNASPQSNLLIQNFTGEGNLPAYAVLQVVNANYTYTDQYASHIGIPTSVNSFIVQNYQSGFGAGNGGGEGGSGNGQPNPTTALVVKDNGYVGINTYTPQAMLDVQGSAIISDNVTAGGDIAVAGSGYVMGRMGIGTASPGAALDVVGNTLISGKVGIGTTSPSAELDVVGNVRINDHDMYLRPDANHGLGWYGTGKLWNGSAIDGPVLYGFAGGALGTNNQGITKTALTWSSNGRVSVGSQIPNGSYTDWLLSVNGNIVCRKVQVQISSWADKVFDKSYSLRPLAEVEDYIVKNKHLPEIPSEKEAIDKGIDLGDMNKLLLQKVEELTLYVINQQKEINFLKNKY
jgi:hypothetical protein